VGNLLDQKAQASSATGHKCLLGASRDESSVVLHLAADEARNHSAGEAMESFYHLVEADGRLSLVLLGQKEVNESVQRAEEMQAKGLHLPVELAVIRKQFADLRNDEVNLRIAILQLNARLKYLLGLPCGDYSLWPLVDLKVLPEVVDVCEAVDYGLHHRPDLALLGTLAYNVDAHSMAVANQALAAVNPLLSEAPTSACYALLHPCITSDKIESTQQRAQALLADRNRQATEEIRQAVGQMAYRVQLVILARQKVEIEELRIKELEEKKAKGLDVEGDLSTARLNLYKAQGEELRETVNWKIARSQLLQAQGRLLAEPELIEKPSPAGTPTQSAP
jgi:outer membrane protein TolC